MIAAVYSDGGVIGVNPSPIGGTWACCLIDECGTTAESCSGYVWPEKVGDWVPWCVETPEVTNNQTEFYALLSALERLPDGWSGRVCSDSAITLGRFFRGFKLTGLPQGWVDRGAAALARLGAVTLVQLDGHPTRAQLAAGVGKRGNPVSAHQGWCDKECGRLARRASLARSA